MKNEYKNRVTKTIVIVVITLVILIWTLINADGFIIPAFMYIALGGLSIFLILIWNKFGVKNDFLGIGKNVGIDTIFGILLALAFIVLQSLNIIGSVLIPYIPASINLTDVGRISIVVIGAMVIEGVFFIGILIPLIDDKLKVFGIDPPLWLSIILVGLLAGIFHFTAYNLSSGLSWGSYFSAVIVFSIFGFFAYWRRSLWSIIIAHGIINFWILNSIYNYIGI